MKLRNLLSRCTCSWSFRGPDLNFDCPRHGHYRTIRPAPLPLSPNPYDEGWMDGYNHAKVESLKLRASAGCDE